MTASAPGGDATTASGKGASLFTGGVGSGGRGGGRGGAANDSAQETLSTMASDTGGKLFASFYALYSGLVLIAATGILLAPFLHRIVHKFHLEKESG